MAQNLLAWGYAGHATLTRVASELIIKEDKNLSPLAVAIQKNAGLLEHLSNIPDTYWQDRDDAKRFHESTNHFLNSEVVAGDSRKRTLPDNRMKYTKAIQKHSSL